MSARKVKQSRPQHLNIKLVAKILIRTPGASLEFKPRAEQLQQQPENEAFHDEQKNHKYLDIVDPRASEISHSAVVDEIHGTYDMEDPIPPSGSHSSPRSQPKTRRGLIPKPREWLRYLLALLQSALSRHAKPEGSSSDKHIIHLTNTHKIRANTFRTLHGSRPSWFVLPKSIAASCLSPKRRNAFLIQRTQLHLYSVSSFIPIKGLQYPSLRSV